MTPPEMSAFIPCDASSTNSQRGPMALHAIRSRTPECEGRGPQAVAERTVKVAYIMSRFPKLTETFVLYEILAIENLGIDVQIYPLLRERPNVMHPEAASLVARSHYQPFLSLPILASQFYFLMRKPLVYLGTIWALLRGAWGNFRFFTGALAIFPKTVHFAHQMAGDGVTHIHGHFATYPAAAAFVIHRLVGIPYSFTAHGSDLHRDRRMLREKVAESDFVVAISDHNREIILKECGEQYGEKTAVIHCGVDTDVFQPRSNDSTAKRSGKPLSILCVGTLHEVKGQTYLLEACRRLKKRGVYFDCHFVGDGPDRASLTRRSKEAGIAEQVHFHGQRTRQEIAQLMSKADVVVAPSVPTSDGRREGIPIVLMEAMASGLPVIASSISGIPELVENERSGLLVPPRDARALTDALERLHATPVLRQKLSLEGRKKVEQQFDLHANAAALALRFGGRIASTV
jgi:colanic acid/amylovoran biosynthesis glycosyltransferase